MAQDDAKTAEAERAALKAIIEKRGAKNPALAATLTALHSRILHELINNVGPDSEWADWRSREALLTAELLGVMERGGCTQQEVAFVRDIPEPGKPRTAEYVRSCPVAWCS